MTKNIKEILLNKNIPISNSFILNNYSIQNIIISPSKVVNHERSHLMSSGSVLNNNNYSQLLSLSTPKELLKKSTIISKNTQKNLISKNLTSIISYKSSNKLNNYKLKNSPVISPTLSQNITSFENNNFSLNYSRTEQKHPQDSIKKINLIKKSQDPIVIKTNNRNLKNSISQRVFCTIKKPKNLLNNLCISQAIKKQEKENIQQSNIIKNYLIKKGLSNFKSKLDNKIIPKQKLNLEEFKMEEQIGKGTFGKIYCARWNKNNKLYALKKETLTDRESVQKRREAFKIIQNFIKNTQSKGVINIYSNLLLKNKLDLEYQYYELMEKAERDWDQEINLRNKCNTYYKESEILNIMKQLISILSLFQKNHITHRDIKPQNILVINGKYKLSDFGEIRILKRDGLIVQRVRGSELYMSPILFHGLHLDLIQVKHNTYKSDVFSLGMCLFHACTLNYAGVDSIRELTSMQKIKEILFHHLRKKYSNKLIMFILDMLEIHEDTRPDFIQLEKKFIKNFE